jgi:SNF2 family DNA or RNA helicase
MKIDKKYSEQLNQLINSLSDFSGQELDEAIEIIRAAGKDPDLILDKVKLKLSEIQRAAKRKNVKTVEDTISSNYKISGFPVLTFDEKTSAIELKEIALYFETIKAEEIYLAIFKNLPFRNRRMNEIALDEKVKGMKFLKIAIKLMFEIDLLPEGVSVRPLLQGLSNNFKIDQEQLYAAIQLGYFVYWNSKINNPRYEWAPIDKESINSGREILGLINENYEIPLSKALIYYQRRSEYPNLIFSKINLDIDSFLKNDTTFKSSNYFIRELYEYQKEGLRWLCYCCLRRLGGILADDMGLGKTAQIISLLAFLIERDVLSRILIVVPGTLIENWRREFNFFAPALVPYIHHGPNRSGSPDELLKHKIVITSYSLIINDLYLFNKISWGLTICDEASLIKNPDSERRNALLAISSEVRIAMTGTPVENSLIDLWSIADYVNPGFLGSRTDFAKKYIRKDIESTLYESDLGLLRQYISMIMLRRRKEDVLDSLPERIDIHQALEMQETEAVLYDEKRKNLKSQYSARAGVNALLEILELRQFTTHPYLIQEHSSALDIKDLCRSSIKFSRTIELLDEIRERNEKVLVFTEYLDMIDIFQEVLSKRYDINVLTIDGRVPINQRQRDIDIFSMTNGFSIMLLNPKTAGMGLNITAANHVIHFTRQWNPALEEQASARSYRNGQKKGVNIYYLYYANTIEEIIDNRLKAKKSLSGEVIVATQETVNEIEYQEILNKSPIK